LGSTLLILVGYHIWFMVRLYICSFFSYQSNASLSRSFLLALCN